MIIFFNNITMFLYAYNNDYDNFIKHYNKESHNSFTDGCVCRGIAFSLDFCISILESNIEFPDFVKKAAYSKLIMNNIIDKPSIIKYKPFCIWYPQVPSKETCTQLINLDNDFNYSLAILCILMNWEDVWSKLTINKDKFLYELAERCGRKWVPKHDESIINIITETIGSSTWETNVETFFTFTGYRQKNVFSFNEPGIFKYSYPLGLSGLYSNGFEHHMINRYNKNYIYNEDLVDNETDEEY